MDYNFNDETFEKQIADMRASRIRQEQEEHTQKKLTGETIYIDFCVWCNAFRKSQGKTDPDVFAEYLKETETQLTFTQRKHLIEKYFGYTALYDYTTEKWTFTKK